MSTSRPDDVALAAAVDRLVDEQRIACLWFLRPDFRPTTTVGRIRVLEQIERHGDPSLEPHRLGRESRRGWHCTQ